MPEMLRGTIALPADTPPGIVAVASIEVRDTSFADAPSAVVAQTSMHHVPVDPGGRIPFTIETPEAVPGRAWSLRVHLSMTGDTSVRPGDLLTVENVPVPEGLSHVAVAVVR
jgi:hypothetical protein